MTGKIKHIEFAGRDGAALKDFYAGLFGWPMVKRENAAFDYFDIQLKQDVTGGIRHEPEGSAETVIYVEVDDLEGAVAHAKSRGASVRIPPLRHGDVYFALINDPEGNPIGLMQG